MKEFLETTRILAEAAGDQIRQSTSKWRPVDYKGRAGLVTDVDCRAEEIILNGIRRRGVPRTVLIFKN